MQQAVKNAQRKAEAARKAQVAAWECWDASQSAEDKAVWMAAADAQDRAEAAVDRAEVWADANEDRQADWWVAAMSNARCAA